MGKREDICEWLQEKGVVYELAEHPPVYTIEEMEKLGLCLRGNVCKNLFLRDAKGKRHFLVLISREKQADLKQLGERIGVRFSFASEERLAKRLNLTKGSVTPLGIYYDREAAVEILVDQDLTGEPRLGVHPCENTATVFLDYRDLERLIRENGNRLTVVKL